MRQSVTYNSQGRIFSYQVYSFCMVSFRPEPKSSLVSLQYFFWDEFSLRDSFLNAYYELWNFDILVPKNLGAVPCFIYKYETHLSATISFLDLQNHFISHIQPSYKLNASCTGILSHNIWILWRYMILVLILCYYNSPSTLKMKILAVHLGANRKENPVEVSGANLKLKITYMKTAK